MRVSLAIALACVLALVPLVGCIGSGPSEDVQPTNTTDPAEEEPPTLPDELTALAPITTVESDGSGTGVWIDEARDLLLSANGGAGLQVFDIQRPGETQLVGQLDDIYARDVDHMEHDGRHLAILAGGGDGIHVVDITDPTDPQKITTASEWSAHNVAVVPGTPFVYDATAVGKTGKVTDPVVPVLDLSNPEDPSWSTIEIPAMVNGQPTQSDGCHDVVTRPDLGKAFCAGGGSMYAHGGGETFIWDISDDPTDPEWLGVVDNPSIVYHHQALASQDGQLLFINDEFIAPNCQRAEAGPLTVKQSTAAMWIYDISDPANPELLSWMQAEQMDAPEPGSIPNCGSHFGDYVDDRDALVWGWYQGGTLLIDVSDPTNPELLDQKAPVGSTWDARYHAGYVYGSSGDVQVFGLE